VYIYYAIIYKDDFSPKDIFCREYWFKYQLGAKNPYHMTSEEKSVLERQITKVYGNKEERCPNSDQAYHPFLSSPSDTPVPFFNQR
jgi:hypothetical protein